MIPDPRQQPYTLPKTDNGVSRRRAFFFVIALAVLLTSIPIVFLVLRGWLAADAPDKESTIVVDMEEPETEEAEYGYAGTEALEITNEAALPAASSNAVAENTAAGNNVETASAVQPPPPVDGAAATAPEGAVVVKEEYISANTGTDAGAPPLTAPATGTTTLTAPATVEPAAAPPVVTIVAPSETTAAPAAANEAAKPEKSVTEKSTASTSAKSATAAKSTATAKPSAKREFRPLSKDELAKLKAANSSSRSTPQQRSAYNKKLYSFVRGNWNAPAPSAVGGRKLRAIIEISVAADGTVSSVRLKTPSYVKAMDDSVNSLIAKLKRRKAPAPGFATGKITIELKN